MGLWIEVGRDGIVTQRVELRAGGITIGRREDSDVVLSDPRVSLAHARVELAGDAVTVTDLGSSLGTRIGGRRMPVAKLAPGAAFTIGPFTLTLTGSAPDGAPAPATSALDALLAITQLVGIPVLDELLEKLLETAVRLLGARQGFVVIVSRGELSPVLVRRGSGSAADGFSRSICKDVLARGKPVLLRVGEPTGEMLPSLAAAPPGLVVAVPLVHEARVTGVLYLETDPASGRLADEPALIEGLSNVGGRALAMAIERGAIVADRDRWKSLATARDEPDFFRTARSPAMQPVCELVRRIAPEDVTALVLGESGTGKEVVARTLHGLSPRRAGPFIAVNCAAIPRDLVESELFGHEAGAFTGATTASPGRLELAQGGTLFLDEVGDLPREAQTKLLRVLEQRTFERVGGRETRAWDARVIAATNRDLEKAVAAGEFRADLYWRLNVVAIRLPALRERREDIEALAQSLLASTRPRFRRALAGFTPEALAWMRAHDWPGNVREMRNAIERAFILESGDRATPASLGLASAPTPPASTAPAPAPDRIVPLEEHLLEHEKRYVSWTLEQHGGNVTRAAEALGLTRQSLHRKLRQLGLSSQP